MLKWTKAFVLVVFLTGILAAGYFVSQKSFLRIQNVEVASFDSSKEQKLFEDIKKDQKERIHSIVGRFFWNSGLHDLGQALQKDKRVESYKISRHFPRGISIEIKPRQPLLSLLDTKGRLHPVAVDASLLPALDATAALDLPLLRGKLFFKNQDMRKKAIAVVEALPEEGPLSRQSVSELSYNASKGFLLTMMGTGTIVRLGQERFAYRIGLALRVLQYLDEHKLQARVIDARFKKKVVVRLRNGS